MSVALKGEIHVIVNEKPVLIQFENGSFQGGSRRGGYCTITDPDIQKALEAHPLFGPMYFCSNTKGTKDVIAEMPEVVNPVIVVEPGQPRPPLHVEGKPDFVKVDPIAPPIDVSSPEPLDVVVEPTPIVPDTSVPIKTTILPEVDATKDTGDHGIIKGVTNSQKAKAALIKRFPGTTNAMLPNTAAIRTFADKHEITFPDWEIK